MNLLNSIPYLLILFTLFVLSIIDIHNVNKKKINNNVRLLAFFVLLFFWGLRGHIQTDWANYYPLFYKLPTIDVLSSKHFTEFTMEPGFLLYAIIIKTVFPNYFFLVFVNTLIDLLFLHFLFKRYVKYYVLAFFFAFIFLSMMEINLMRNSKSIMLFMLSLIYVNKKKWVGYYLLNILGCTFHMTSLLFLFIYPILKIQFKTYVLVIIFLLCISFYLIGIQWITPLVNYIGNLSGIPQLYKLITYNEMGVGSVLSIGFLERLTSFTLLIVLYRKLVHINSYSGPVLNCFLLYFIFMFFFAESEVISHRLAGLFLVSYCFFYSYLYQYLKKYKNLLLYLTLIYGCLKMIGDSRSEIGKYQNILFGAESYDERMRDLSKWLNEN